MDIGKGGVSSSLSNFSPNPFRIYIDELPKEIQNNLNFYFMPVDVLSLLEREELDIEDDSAENKYRLYYECSSMEGFLQGLKSDKVQIQLSIARDVGLKAKRRGAKRNKNWKSKQTLWFFGIPMKRDSKTYQDLLDVAFNSLFRNEKFKKNLLSTNGMVLTHSIGKRKIQDTVLTVSEFCSRLTKLRDYGKI